eukprot:TRINITY_DN54806_c0_g1_i1.p1 TRINITY_DN54806_c0_g1~~TRINITY_DN54806_c0_g1_i1.p1  ORF type:complete len:878 (-),score=70.63 TRINITY_DN54806_c0_g1_i1:112-2448(-)
MDLSYIDLTLHCTVYSHTIHKLEHFRQKAKDLEDYSTSQTHLMDQSLGTWKRLTLRLYFNAWKKFCFASTHVDDWFDFLNVMRGRHETRLCFTAWVLYTYKMRIEKAEKEHQQELQQEREKAEVQMAEMRKAQEEMAAKVEELQKELDEAGKGVGEETMANINSEAVYNSEVLKNKATQLEKRCKHLGDQLQDSKDHHDQAMLHLEGLREHLQELNVLATDTLIAMLGEADPKVGQRPHRGSAAMLVKNCMIQIEAWKQCKEPEFLSIEEGSEEDLVTDEMLQELHPERFLLFWFNALLDGSAVGKINKRRCRNFSTDLCDCELFLALGAACFPERMTMEGSLQAVPPLQRGDIVLDQMEKLGIYSTQIIASDLVESCTEANVMLTTLIFEKFQEANAQHLVTGDDMHPELITDENILRTRLLRLHKLHQTVQRTYANWNKITKWVTLHALNVLAARARGKRHEAVDERFSQEVAAYTAINRDRLLDIFPKEMDEEAINLDVQQLALIIRKYYPELRKHFMYSHYSTRAIQRTMNSEQWNRFWTDCKLVTKTFTQQNLNNVWARVTSPTPTLAPERKPSSVSQIDGNDGRVDELNATLWVEALIRMADARMKYTKGNTVPSSKLEKFLVDHVLSRAFSNEVDAFKDLVYSTKMQHILALYHKNLHKVFCHFTSDASPADNPNATINVHDFHRLFKECDMVDKYMSRNEVFMIFSTIQDPMSGSPAEDIVFREFIESLVVVALYRVPSPLIPHHNRAEIFLTKLLFPALRQKVPKLKLN